MLIDGGFARHGRRHDLLPLLHRRAAVPDARALRQPADPHRPVDRHRRRAAASWGLTGTGPYITHVTCGKIVDMGITDANNMGAAMAPAAYDTLSALFRETGTGPGDYDLIVTGDLGALGHAIVHGPLPAGRGGPRPGTTRTADCCCMTGRSRTCTPEAPAAAARRRC